MSPQEGCAPPPGDWLGTDLRCPNEESSGSPPTFPLTSTAAAPVRWKSWSEVPLDPVQVAQHGPFFLEIFSGTARLTQQVALLGVPVLPPIDIEISEMVPQPADLLDLGLWDRVMALAHIGAIFFVHLGTPCNTFTAARKLDGGPPPLRSVECPLGLPGLSPENQSLVTLGNLFVSRSVEISLHAEAIFRSLWQTPAMHHLETSARAMDLDFDQCAFGAPSVKPTRLRVSSEALQDVCLSCPGDHEHELLQNQVWDPRRHRMVFRTKLAQEYPHALCATMALAVQQLRTDDLAHLAPSFALTTPAADRKRALGQPARWFGHRQEGTARKALASGYQLKRRARAWSGSAVGLAGHSAVLSASATGG